MQKTQKGLHLFTRSAARGQDCESLYDIGRWEHQVFKVDHAFVCFIFQNSDQNLQAFCRTGEHRGVLKLFVKYNTKDVKIHRRLWTI